ncbi:MAG: PDZ domain-containing protein, partial [Brooklawnia sp.]|uniref:PDZ domain-containing protein n=1 Tax=Brooklawnia sp. TaxID=2699740 RepID=UPI003C731958
QPGSPGAIAGLREGDLVVTVGGQPVTDAQDLQRRLFTHVPGGALAITTYRNGAMVDVIARPALLREG